MLLGLCYTFIQDHVRILSALSPFVEISMSLTKLLRMIFFSVHCQVISYSSLFALRCLLFTLHSSLFTLHSSLFTLCSLLFALRSSLFALRSSLFTLHSLLFTLCSLLFTLCSLLFALHSSLFIHFSLVMCCISYYRKEFRNKCDLSATGN